jgi:hypothetical protein
MQVIGKKYVYKQTSSVLPEPDNYGSIIYEHFFTFRMWVLLGTPSVSANQPMVENWINKAKNFMSTELP